MSLNIVEPSYTSTNHHNSSKDGFDKYMKRCINTKIKNGKTKADAYNICNQEYHGKKNKKMNK
jgi:hypothetical protein